ncbi:MAG TPA: hypothetical protein DDW27_21040 [Bacteroidales bacterium]|jgi:hypothetical protein|nr:hypothetical protein [Bacteroidales bacterium]
MKTKTLIMVCFLIGIGLTQLSAQNGKSGKVAFPSFMEWDGYYMDLPVECDKTNLDRLVGLVYIHVVRFWIGEIFAGEIAWFKGEVTSAKTGEVFTVKDHFKYDAIANPYIGSGHCTLNGSSGSRYLLFYDYNIDGTYIFTKVKCN